MSGGLIIFLEIIAPLVALIIYGRIKIVKARRKAEAEDTSAVTPALPFEPRPEPTPGPLLRLFTTPQRAYLRQQIALAKAFYYIVGWISLVLFTAGLLPSYVNEYGLQQPLSQRVWYSYLDHVMTSEIWFAFVILMAAVLAVSALTSGAPAVFNRTRPLTRRFLFWARVLPAIATVLAAIVTGVIISFLLLLVFYGPVWLHLLDMLQAPNGSVALQALTDQQSTHLARMVQISAPAIFLSLASTAVLIFSVVIVLVSQPISFLGKKVGKATITPIAVAGSVIGVEVIHAAHGMGLSHFSRTLFVYLSFRPPPPYGYVLVPLAISALLLFLAQFCVARKDL